jgi:translation elongation factor EF-G
VKRIIEEGVANAWDRGFLGFPLIDTEVIITAANLSVETGPSALRKCANQLVNAVVNSSNPKLLEPIMNVEVCVLCSFHAKC